MILGGPQGCAHASRSVPMQRAATLSYYMLYRCYICYIDATYIYIYIYICICVYVYMCVYIYIYIYINVPQEEHSQ